MVYIIDENATEATLNVWSEEPATLELYDIDMDMIERTAVSPLTSPAKFNVSPGRYHLRARTLEGRAARVPVTLEPGHNSIYAEDIWGNQAAVRSGRRPDRSGPVNSGWDRILQGGRYHYGLAQPGPNFETLLKLVQRPDGLRVTPIWLPMPTLHSDDVEPPDFMLRYPDDQQKDTLEIGFGQKDGLIFAQFAPEWSDDPGREISVEQVITMSLPAMQARLVMRGDPEIDRSPVNYVAAQPNIAALLALLQAEAPDAPVEALGIESVNNLTGMDSDQDARDVLNQLAYQLVRGKFEVETPVLAAAGAFYLLKINHLQKVRDWPRNIADYFPWMPDGAIVEGWRRMVSKVDGANPPYPAWRNNRPPPSRATWPEPKRKRPDAPLIDAALRFVEAVHRGPPVLSIALERLRDGLSFCARRRLANNDFPDLDEDVERASETARIWSAAALPGSPVTAFAAPLNNLIPGREARLIGEPIILGFPNPP